MANGGEWWIYGITKDGTEELVGVYAYWYQVVNWMRDKWGMTHYYGITVRPDAEMRERVESV